MPLRHAVLTHVEQDRSTDEGPSAAYLMAKSGSPGTYVFGAGRKTLEGAAFLKESGTVFVLDDNVIEEDRSFILIGGTSTIIV